MVRPKLVIATFELPFAHHCRRPMGARIKALREWSVGKGKNFDFGSQIGEFWFKLIGILRTVHHKLL